MSIIEIGNNLQQQLNIARREIHNLRKQLKAIQHNQRKQFDNVIEMLKNWQCSSCKNNKPEVKSSTSTQNSTGGFNFKPIGIIKSEFPRIRGTPRQPTITANNTTAKLTLSKDIFTNPSHALQDLSNFSHFWIIFVFHQNNTHAKAKVAPPRLNGARTGVFATRSPHRPCPIGLSLVEIDRIIDNVIYFKGVDMIDQTPVLDIKPYIPHYDHPGMLEVQNVDESHISVPIYKINKSEVELLTETYLVDKDAEGDNVLEAGSVNEYLHEHSRTGRMTSFLQRDKDDGEEVGLEYKSQVANLLSEVKVPEWISQAPVPRLTVSFKDSVLTQLNELEPTLANEKVKTIASVLQEDPRSVYLREKLGDSHYTWRIDDLCVECRFNDADHSVKVVRIVKNNRQQRHESSLQIETSSTNCGNCEHWHHGIRNVHKLY